VLELHLRLFGYSATLAAPQQEHEQQLPALELVLPPGASKSPQPEPAGANAFNACWGVRKR